MSNSIGSNFVHQRLLEHQTRIDTCVSGGNYTLFRVQDSFRIRKLPLTATFRVNVARKRLSMSSNRGGGVMTRAVLATDSPSEVHSP